MDDSEREQVVREREARRSLALEKILSGNVTVIGNDTPYKPRRGVYSTR